MPVLIIKALSHSLKFYLVQTILYLISKFWLKNFFIYLFIFFYYPGTSFPFNFQIKIETETIL